ncbi:MAG: single-stranded-DNA-specific exonuclease RecJ [Edaphocola sp.]
MTKVWKIKDVDKSITAGLAECLNIHPVLCGLLAQRGVTDYDSAKSFFRPQLGHLHNPFLMKGMASAVSRIEHALSHRETIMVYGDYDVDGTTSVAVVYSFLSKKFPEANVHYYVPHRYREGYGVSEAGVRKAADLGVTLMITLDCGIKSVGKAALAKQLGIDMIICDHHTPDEDQLPQAIAILNPKQSDCPYPYKELSGCGIGYKLISALAAHYGLPAESTEKYLDLVATSIAADIVPMDGENRILAFYGLKRANENPCLALKTIRQIAAITRPFTIADLVFIVAPRINAAGRMDDARKAIELFIEEDELKSRQLAEVLHADNFDRKEVDKNMTDEALGILQTGHGADRHTTVLYRPHWHKGVVGIVASRLIEHYYRPTIILTESNGKLTGSARSVNGFNIYEAIHQCGDLLENYGGHFFAAGMTLQTGNLEAFRQRFEQVVKATIGPDSMNPVLHIDCELNFKDIGRTFYNIVTQFEPFGPTNLRPVFISRNVYDYKNCSKVVKEAHIRFVVAQPDGKYVMNGIGFGLAEKFEYLQPGKPFDMAYTIDENEWNGTASLQLKVIDIRPATGLPKDN